MLEANKGIGLIGLIGSEYKMCFRIRKAQNTKILAQNTKITNGAVEALKKSEVSNRIGTSKLA